MLNARGDLSAAELAFFAPAFLISLLVVFRHGFSRRLGWFYLLILSILRIIGASCTLYMEINNDYSASLLETAAITSAVGTAPLLLALMGFLERINMGLEQGKIGGMVWRVVHFVPLVALGIAIAGGVELFSGDAKDEKTGKALQEAASILFLAIYISLAGIVCFFLWNARWVVDAERKLLYAGVVSLPFLLVRITYSVATAFSGAGSVFYYLDVDVWVQAFMQFAMEAVVVVVYIVAGLLTPKAPSRKSVVDGGEMGGASEFGKSSIQGQQRR